MTCYITAYYDINRDNWPYFHRTFESYLKGFKPFIKLFNNIVCKDDEMIVYIDSRHYCKLETIIIPNTNIKLISITEELINNLYIWKTLDIERENMNSENFKTLVGNRIIFPECIYPEYTLINHCKIDFISRVIDMNLSDKIYYTWVDFGLFNEPENVPYRLLDITRLNLDKINYNLLNPINDSYKDVNLNLMYAPEIIGGGVFFGRKDKMKEYQSLYYQILDYFQNTLHIADDDQHLVLQCYFKKPELFELHTNYGWFEFFKILQKPYLKVISYALWGKDLKYERGLIENIKLAKKYYIEWQCWVYIHLKSVNVYILKELQLYDNVKVIIKDDLEIRRNRFMLWRFEPIDDPLVEYLMSRDTDTLIFPREVLAVDDWITSGKSLHIMRDHPQHFPKILGGMYGVKCDLLKSLKKNWKTEIELFFNTYDENEDDQKFLELSLYSLCENDRIIHDEIQKYEGGECKQYKLPFEKNGNFVGCYIYEDGSSNLQISNILLNWLYSKSPDRISSHDRSFEDTLSYISNKIKNIYIMHYSKLDDRKKHLQTQLKNMLFDKFFNINWIENFDREDITQEMINMDYKYNPVILSRQMTLPEIANGLAHVYIIEQIKNNDDIAIILEDDTIFKEDFVYHLHKVLSELPEDWDIICLGGPTNEESCPSKCVYGATRLKFDIEEIHFIKPTIPAVCTMSCLLINKRGTEKILESSFVKPLSTPIDDAILKIGYEKDLKIYWCQPFITFEGSKSELYNTTLDRGF